MTVLQTDLLTETLGSMRPYDCLEVVGDGFPQQDQFGIVTLDLEYFVPTKHLYHAGLGLTDVATRYPVRRNPLLVGTTEHTADLVRTDVKVGFESPHTWFVSRENAAFLGGQAVGAVLVGGFGRPARYFISKQ